MNDSQSFDVLLRIDRVLFAVPIIMMFGAWLISMIAFRSLSGSPRTIAPDLVLEKYEIDEKNPLGLVRMVGRRAGFWGWWAHELGIAKSYEVHVSTRFVMLMAPGFADGFHAVLPVEKIVTVTYEYRRPLKALLVAIALAVYPCIPQVNDRIPSIDRGLFVAVCLFCAFACLFYYLLRRQVRFLISAGDGYWGVHYMVGSAGSFEKAAATLNIVRNLITGSGPAPGRPHPGPPGFPVEPAYPAIPASMPPVLGVVDIELGAADRKPSGNLF